jgi:hypothetical protein
MASNASAFSVAVQQFVNQPTKKKKSSSFIHRIASSKSHVTIEDVQDVLSQMESSSAQRGSRRILRPVYTALQDYYKVIDTLGKA